MKPEKKEFERQVIRILRPVPDGERGNEIVVVRYYSEGRIFAPQLANQEIYTDKISRKRKNGKVKGFKWGDFKFLTETPERIAEIQELLLDSPFERKKSQPRSGQDAAANDQAPDEAPPLEADEQVPF